ncbi:hypothetical protein CDD81_2079 [Ophiocordyceps australis]|uniref:Uncharacterized protein n=1 Tax=Ophiocordyceps australis TaxID=1399860 RepID=A0A2C5XZW3_9HYPO|nr:hypothetical protein CDD81_2079 [Ophiocordyceps australis]
MDKMKQLTEQGKAKRLSRCLSRMKTVYKEKRKSRQQRGPWLESIYTAQYARRSYTPKCKSEGPAPPAVGRSGGRLHSCERSIGCHVEGAAMSLQRRMPRPAGLSRRCALFGRRCCVTAAPAFVSWKERRRADMTLLHTNSGQPPRRLAPSPHSPIHPWTRPHDVSTNGAGGHYVLVDACLRRRHDR